MLSSQQSPRRIQKRPSRRDLSQSPSKSPVRPQQRRQGFVTNPLGLQHLNNILDQGPTLEPTGQYPSQHTMQEAQQQRPAQPGHPGTTNYQQQIYQQPQMSPQMIQVLQEQAQAQQMAQSSQEHQLRAFYQTCAQYAAAGASPEQMHSPMHSPTMLNIPYEGPYDPRAQRINYMPTPPSTATSVRTENMVVQPVPMSYYGVAYPQAEHGMQRVQHLYPGGYPTQPQYPQRMPATPSPCSSPVRAPVGLPHGCDDGLMVSPSRHQGQAYVIDSPMIPMSPREAMLANMNVDASIEDTGISAEEVQSYMSEQDPIDQKWTCLFEDCGKRFGRKENIRSHVQTHLGDRQFKCNTCSKCFVRQHDLKRHAKIHSGHKPYVCPCGNGFARQDALTRHRQRGVCEGALPGFERREVKRGRPKKVRTDDTKSDEDNTDEASSPESEPDTPADSPAAETVADADGHLADFIKAYGNTDPMLSTNKTNNDDFTRKEPLQMLENLNLDLDASDPSSPSPLRDNSPDLPRLDTATSTGIFSDASLDWGIVEPQPSLCNDAFSPPALSSSALGEFEDDDSFLRDAFGSAPKDALLEYNASSTFEPLEHGDQMPTHLDAWLEGA